MAAVRVVEFAFIQLFDDFLEILDQNISDEILLWILLKLGFLDYLELVEDGFEELAGSVRLLRRLLLDNKVAASELDKTSLHFGF